jgi:hypothetical protein
LRTIQRRFARPRLGRSVAYVITSPILVITSPIRVITMPIRVITMPIPVITMRRSG